MKLLVFLLLPCLSLSELSQGFAKCNKFFLNDPPQFTPQWGTSVKYICQCVRDNNQQQKCFYATLYSTDWRIPIYSAYVFKKALVKRKDPWYIEPQLDGDAEACMAPEGKIKKTITNQAVNDDYEGQDFNGPTYDKGHLYPAQHTYDEDSMLSSSTLTNAAPQDACFNRLQWCNHEKVVIKDLKSCESEAYVVTGVVPDITKPKLNARVTVSKYYWRAYCCLLNGVYTGKGYFGPDGNYMTVQTVSIEALQKQLATDYRVNNVIIFPSLLSPPILPPTTPGQPQLAGAKKRPWEDENQEEDDCN